MKIEKIKRRNSFIWANMRIGKIASIAEYQMDKGFQNLLIFGFRQIFGFPN